MSNDKAGATYHPHTQPKPPEPQLIMPPQPRDILSGQDARPSEHYDLGDVVIDYNPRLGYIWRNGQQFRLYDPQDLSLDVAYILLFFFGALGVHRFYQGKVGTGLLWLFTLGLFGVGIIVDVFTLGSQLHATNYKRRNQR